MRGEEGGKIRRNKRKRWEIRGREMRGEVRVSRRSEVKLRMGSREREWK